jgi:hypothetical protein
VRIAEEQRRASSQSMGDFKRIQDVVQTPADVHAYDDTSKRSGAFEHDPRTPELRRGFADVSQVNAGRVHKASLEGIYDPTVGEMLKKAGIPEPPQEEPYVPSDDVNHPNHYGGDTTYEVIKVLRAWLTPDEFSSLGSVKAMR